MRARCLIPLLTAAALAVTAQPAPAADQAVTVRHARGWQANAAEGWCDIRVLVDGEADFALRGETLVIRTLNGEPAREVGSECSTPLPGNVLDFRFQGVDGRGDVRLLEQPSARNRWTAVVRIRDAQGGREEYHYRLEWGRGSSFSGDRGAGRPGGGNRWSAADLARMRTRDLRREIERIYRDTNRRAPAIDTVDDYIDRVRMDGWSLDRVQADIERGR